MNHFFFGLLLMLLAVEAKAVPVQIDFSLPAAKEFASLLLKRTVFDAQCVAMVDRPDLSADATSSPDNAVLCKVEDVMYRFPLGNSTVEAAGTHFDKTTFLVRGEFANAITPEFRKKTIGLDDIAPEDSLWSKMVICDPAAGACYASYVLAVSAGRMSSGQIICARNTQGKPGEHFKPSQDYSHYGDYLEAQIDAQLANGTRTVKDTFCTFQ